MMIYTKLSLADVTTEVGKVARDAQTTFGALDERQLNWRPAPDRWSIAQCFDHLVRGNALLLEAAQRALREGPRSVWQRLPLWPALFGWLLIRSQGPKVSRKFTAPSRARPATSQLPGDIIHRFVAQHLEAEVWMRGLDQRVTSRAIMISPFIEVVTYSVLDGLRLMVAHDRRHFEQARRVMLSLNVGASGPRQDEASLSG